MPTNRSHDLGTLGHSFESRLRDIQANLSLGEANIEKHRDEILVDLEKVQKIARDVLEATDYVKLRLLRDHPSKLSPFAGHIKGGRRA